LDSVGVGDQLTLKPPHVRQLLWRLNGIWTEKFGGEAVPRRKLKRWPPFDHQRAAELRLTGMSYAEIARQLNARPHAVKGVLDKMGIKAPPRVKVERPAHKPMHRIDTKRAAELRASGMTWREVADAFGHKSCTGILGAMKRAGLFVRSNKVCVRKQKGQASPAPHLPERFPTRQ
jgi:transposase-like protein